MADHRDIFLKVETLKQGAIKGESRDKAHQDEIDVVGWSWGMHTRGGISSSGQGGKATLNELNVTKLVDSASTALMAAMRNNETIKKAVLTARKAGKGQLDYLKVTLENARITAFDIATSREDAGSQVSEKLSFAFHKITVEYVPQGEDGQARGGMMFATETNPTGH